MVQRRISLKQLQRAIAKERAKAKTASERAELERELRQLRAGTSAKLLKRFGRGFVILTQKGAKATGRGIVKARKFAEESGAGEGLDIRLRSSISQPPRRPVRMKPRRIKRRRAVRKVQRTLTGRDDMFAPLDF